VAQIISLIATNSVTLKAAAKHELLFNKAASDWLPKPIQGKQTYQCKWCLRESNKSFVAIPGTNANDVDRQMSAKNGGPMPQISAVAAKLRRDFK
jgi:hypothetical protein